MNFDENSRLYPDRGAGRSFPVTTTLEKTMLIIVAIAVTITVGLIICIVSMKQTNEKYHKELKLKYENTCVSATCISEASNLIKSMDLSVDPCTDFYSFVCGNWIKNHYLISSLETQFTELSVIISLRIKEILEDLGKKKNLPENKKKISDFYKSCMDDVHRKVKGETELLSDLEKFGGWPIIEEKWNANFDWADLMIQLFKNGYINNMLFTLRVDVDTKNTTRSLITIYPPTLGLIKKEIYTLPYEDYLTSYKNVIFELARYLKPDIDEKKSLEDIEAAFKIEDKLAHLSSYSYKAYQKTLTELEASAPKIQWRKLLQNLLPPDTELKGTEPIIFYSPSLIEDLNTLFEGLDNTDGKRTLANYMFYRVVFNAANYLSKKFYSIKMSLSETTFLPWDICAKVTSEFFPLPMAASYVAKYMNNNTKKELGIMFEDMRDSLMNNIRNSRWLDETTKNYALLKARKMEAAIAYEDEIMDDDKLDSYYKDVIITEDYFDNVKHVSAFLLRHTMEGLHEKRIRFKWSDINNLLTANAYYRPNDNSIIIPVGVLQDTVFAAGRPKYINYGSLGMIIGHELTHAFDSIGSFYDAEGSDRMWWTSESWKNFEERKKCFVNQYNNYYLPTAKSYINGTLTLSENIADNGGLKTAYYAYKAFLHRIGSEKSLPGLPYNEKQMFWISFASVWCRKQTAESMKYSVTHSVHTPSQFRVIGSLSNLKEFSEDFSCNLNSAMNPTSKCFLWE